MRLQSGICFFNARSGFIILSRLLDLAGLAAVLFVLLLSWLIEKSQIPDIQITIEDMSVTESYIIKAGIIACACLGVSVLLDAHRFARRYIGRRKI